MLTVKVVVDAVTVAVLITTRVSKGSDGSLMVVVTVNGPCSTKMPHPTVLAGSVIMAGGKELA